MKTLEETYTGLFILITQKPEKLLSTIRSRCQIVPFIRLNDNQVNKIIEKSEVVQEIDDVPSEKIRELIDFSYGSPGRCLKNLKLWLSFSTQLRQKLETQLNNPIELLKLAKEITDELNIEQQLWLIDFQQNLAWIKEKNSNIVLQLEELRKQLLKFVQPRLAWEVTLLEINLLD